MEREICTLRMKSKPLQIDGELDEHGISAHQEMIPTDEPRTCPDILQSDAYHAHRLVPDDFIMDRCQKVVQKLFLQHFGKMTSRENIRRYACKVTRYLGQAAYNFEGSLTEEILNCIIENLQDIIPKKYLVVLTRDHLEKMFNEILAVFDYERSDVNTEDVVSGIFDNAREALNQAGTSSTAVMNKTQFVLVHMFKELIEILPLEEFQSDDTVRFIADNLEKEAFFDARCINIEGLVEKVVDYAKANFLDAITAIPIRTLAVRVQKECTKRRPHYALSVRCSIGSVQSVSVKSKDRLQ